MPPVLVFSCVYVSRMSSRAAPRLSSSFPPPPQIESVEIHPTFDITSYIGDVAIVTMARSFTREQAVAAGVYPAKLGTDGMVGPHTELSLSGWGVTNVDVAAQEEAAAAAAAAEEAASAAAPDVNAYDTYPYQDAYGHEAVDAYARQRITPAGTVGGHAARGAPAGPSATARRTATSPPPPPARPMPVMLRQAGVPPQNWTAGAGPPPPPGRRLASPNTLLTAKVFARPMAECITFAQDVIGVSEFATSLYDADSELCLSLMDNVGACSGDRYATEGVSGWVGGWVGEEEDLGLWVGQRRRGGAGGAGGAVLRRRCAGPLAFAACRWSSAPSRSELTHPIRPDRGPLAFWLLPTGVDAVARPFSPK